MAGIEDVPEDFLYVYREPVRAAIAAEGVSEEREAEILVALHENDEREVASSPFSPRLDEIPDEELAAIREAGAHLFHDPVSGEVDYERQFAYLLAVLYIRHPWLMQPAKKGPRD